MDSALLLLVDGRFPAGGHTCSGGVEAAISSGDVIDAVTLERYLSGRLATTGRVDASFAAATCAQGGDVDRYTALDAEYRCRVMSPYLCSTSRRLGRQLVRAAQRVWPSPELDAVGALPGGPFQPMALGAAVSAGGGSPNEAASVAFHHLGAAVTTAAVRLLGLDPMELAAIQARAGRVVWAGRAEWDSWTSMQPRHLPADGGMLSEILGERHGQLDARMFVA